MQVTMKALTLLSLLLAPSLSAQTLLLGGELKASEQQLFHAPKTDSWRVQVQWIKKEGEIADAGEVVVVFDSGSIAIELEQKEAELITKKEALVKARSTAQQTTSEKQFELEKANLNVDIAKIDALVPQSQLSKYDYDQYQLNLETAFVAKQKAMAELEKAKVDSEVNIRKAQLEISKLEFDIDLLGQSLEKMSLTAQRSGPVVWANHPWNGSKLYPGVTAQAGWKIAEIPTLSGLYIEAWVHEVDYQYLTIGDTATLTFDANLGQSYEAKLTALSTQPEERQQWGESAYYQAQFEFDHAHNQELLPGMSARLVLETGESSAQEPSDD